MDFEGNAYGLNPVLSQSFLVETEENQEKSQDKLTPSEYKLRSYRYANRIIEDDSEWNWSDSDLIQYLSQDFSLVMK